MDSKNPISPPAWPLRLLRTILHPDYLEEIEGDMEELFAEISEDHSPSSARRKYVWDVLRLFRLSLLKPILPFQPQTIMLRNHITIAFRVLSRGKAFTAINLIGMMLGLAIALMIIIYVRFEMSYESSNPLADRIMRITIDYMDGETVVDQDCETYPPLAPIFSERIPEVEKFTRAYSLDEQIFRIGDDVYREAMVYATDPDFLEMFDYPLLHGSREGMFESPNEIILTESVARKYFGRTDVVGETLLHSSEQSFIVKGIIKDSPLNTHLKVHILVSYPTLIAHFGEREDNWNGNNTLAYLQLTDADQEETFLEKLVESNNSLHEEDRLKNEQVIAQKMTEIHLYSHKSFEVEENGDATSVFFLLGVAILIIIISIVNYINLATSRSLDRAREVGIRKVLGSTLGQLRIQFFLEALLINLGAAILAIGLISISVPQFRNIAGLPDSFSVLGEPIFWGLLVAIVLLSTFLSGIFPAFIMSSFQPVQVLKGKFGHSSLGVIMRKGLVVFQFAITIFLLTQTLTSFQQLRFLRTIDLGTDVEQTIVVRAPQGEVLIEKYSTFKDKVLAYPEFESVSLSTVVPGLPTKAMATTTGIHWVEAVDPHNYNFYITFVDEDFFSTMKMEMLFGENFLPDAENNLQIVVNEEAIRLWGIASAEAAIGEQVEYWGDKRTIIGVIKNFHQAGAKSDFIPMIFMYSRENGELASIRTIPGNSTAQLSKVKELYTDVFPASPFDYFFMDQEYDKQYKEDERFQNVFGTLTGLAIFIACFGLFGLVAFSVAKRSKEIGIRKILGASVSHIVTLFSKDFLILIMVASAIAIPVTYLIVTSWLEQYAFRIDLSVWLFLIPTFSVLLLAGITILSRTIGISRSNPIDAIQEE